MTLQSELSDRELDKALAIALGWSDVFHINRPDAPEVLGAVPPNGRQREIVPHWSASLDALSEVEARLREAGCRIVSSSDALTVPHFECEVILHDDAGLVWYGGDDDSEARARATACLLALTYFAALNSPTPTAKGDA